jgi:hypothetical protein
MPISTTPNTGSKMRRGMYAVANAPRIEPGIAAERIDAALAPVAERAGRRVRRHHGERERGHLIDRPARLEQHQQRDEQKTAAGSDQRPQNADGEAARGGDQFGHPTMIRDR